MKLLMSKYIYRIHVYLSISLKILDSFRGILFGFDLYVGHKVFSFKSPFLSFLNVSDQSDFIFVILKICNFGHFSGLKSSLRLIRGSTYTRVYTVHKQRNCRFDIEQKHKLCANDGKHAD